VGWTGASLLAAMLRLAEPEVLEIDGIQIANRRCELFHR